MTESEQGLLAGRYRLDSELGKGAMGVVWRATDTQMGRPVAVKQLLPDSTTPRQVIRFHREAKAASRLMHTNVAQIYDFGNDQSGAVYLVSEFIEGKTLRDELSEKGPLEVEEALAIASQVASGLDHAHALGILHRDIKPDNVILVRDERGEATAKIVDFGLSKLLDEDQGLTGTGAMLGTPPYMSPEAASGKALDDKTDIYSLGCVLYEMLAGHYPFQAESAVMMLRMHMEEPVPSLLAKRDDIVDQVDDLVRKCMEKSPASRFQSAGELAVELRRQIGMEPNGEAEEPVATGPRKSAWPALTIPVGIMAVLFAGLAWYESERTTSPLATRRSEYVDDVRTGPQMSKQLEAVLDQDEKMKVERKSDGAIWISHVVDPHELTGLPESVKSIRLRRVVVTGDNLTFLAKYDIERLVVTECKVDDSAFARVAGCKSLKYFDLNHSSSWTPRELRSLNRLERLHTLVLSHTDVDDDVFATIATFRQLRELSIQSCKSIRGDGIDALSMIPNLRELYMGDSGFSGSNIKQLSTLKALKVLYLKNCGVGDSDLEPLRDLPLVLLRLEDNEITETGLKTLARIKTLKDLRLRGNPITRKGIDEFKSSRPDCKLTF